MPCRKAFLTVLILYVIAIPGLSALAETYSVNDRPLNLVGYLTQGSAFSLSNGKYYDTEAGWQSAITTLLIEGDYRFTDNLKVYGAGMFLVDWIYDAKSDAGSWNDKLFSKSRNELYMDDRYWQMLKEAHVTWTPGNFLFRLGKQIVSWGETDGFRLMDQINPLDQRRGFADVEFESTIIPIWLIRTEYHTDVPWNWLTDLRFEAVLNPNADFIPNQPIKLGNDQGGIWAPNILVPFGPDTRAYLGSPDLDLRKPSAWSPDGMELGLRIRGTIQDSIITLNYFKGIDNDYVATSLPMPPRTDVAPDGRLVIHPAMKGYYPDLQFAGITFSRDLQSMQSSFLGGVAPVIRMEGFYAFDSTFANDINALEKHNELRWCLGLDWKVKISWLNPRAFVAISPQFYHRKIIDYPSDHELTGLDADNYMTTLMVKTSYLNGKLTPSIFWMRDVTTQSDMYRYQIDYQYTNNWIFKVGALVLDGNIEGKGFQVFEHKDQVYFSVSYRWG
ncbi:MAG: hypothetical protein HQK60_07460 [Deltaproteobacteria bacterium]|nr:hypothetical protein [Deltaproteobacteria bacterium]